MVSPNFPNWNRRQREQAAQDAGQNRTNSLGNRQNYSLGSSIKNKIKAAVTKSLGGLGALVDALIRPGGKKLADTDEMEAAIRAELAKELGKSAVEKISESGSRIIPGRQPTWMSSTPQLDNSRQPPNSPPLIEPWIEVSSSNVWGFSYRHPLEHTGNGDLLVCFLGQVGKSRQGQGASYAYLDCPYHIFESFKHAASAGKFVWDELRVRGSVVQHQYAYNLESIGNLQSVPRQAAIKRGHASGAEFYVPRTLGGRRSSLPEQQVRGPRGALPGFENNANLSLRSRNNGRTRGRRP